MVHAPESKHQESSAIPSQQVVQSRALCQGHSRLAWDPSHSKYRDCAGSGATESSAVGLAAAMEEDREAFSGKRAEEAAEHKKWRAEQRETLDDLLPKAIGR